MKIDRNVTTVIDESKCIGCGSCIDVCPKDTISMVDGKAVVTGDESLVCDHCRAACENDAISVGGIDHSLGEFSHFSVSREWLPHGEYNTAELVNLMLSRRSCRNYLESPVPRSLLEDLVKIGVTAPSGSNCQQWSFTILPDRQSVLSFGDSIKEFFHKINQLSQKTWIRKGLKLIGKPDLDWYYINYYEQIKDAIKRWDEDGEDVLFHGATAAIVVGSKNSASCPSEDALLATQNILLGAHALGLGTCLIGYAIKAMNRDDSIRRKIGLPEDEDPYAVIALGFPNETFVEVTGRKSVTIRYFNL